MSNIMKSLRVGVGSFQNILNPTAYNYPQYNNVNSQFNLNQQPTGWLPQYLNQVTSLIQFNNDLGTIFGWVKAT